MLVEFMRLRKPTIAEQRLLSTLVSKATSLILPVNWNETLQVQSMDDGEMGSLQLFPQGLVTENRTFGETVSECQFTDADGTQVLASLNTDQNGDLFELDVWKTNFSKLIQIPEILDEKKIDRRQI